MGLIGLIGRSDPSCKSHMSYKSYLFSIEHKVKCEHADCAHRASVQLCGNEEPLFGRLQRGVAQEWIAGYQNHISDGAGFRDVDLDLHRALNPRLPRDFRVRRLHFPEHPSLCEFARQPDDSIWRRRRSRFYNWRWRRRRWRRSFSHIRPSQHSIAAANSQINRRANCAQIHRFPLRKQLAQLIRIRERYDLDRRHETRIYYLFVDWLRWRRLVIT